MKRCKLNLKNVAMILSFIAGSMMMSCCSSDDQKDDTGNSAAAACAAKAHPDSTFTWDNNKNKCVATYIYEAKKAACAAKTHADSTFAWDGTKNKCVATFFDRFAGDKAACAAKTHADSTFAWNDILKKCEGKYIGLTPEAKIAKLKEEIAALVADSAATIKAGRAALKPALSVPTNLNNIIWDRMKTNLNIPRATFLDTLNYITELYELMHNAYGDWANPETMGIYLALGERFKAIVADLKAKREELKALQGGKKSTAISQATAQTAQTAIRYIIAYKGVEQAEHIEYARRL